MYMWCLDALILAMLVPWNNQQFLEGPDRYVGSQAQTPSMAEFLSFLWDYWCLLIIEIIFSKGSEKTQLFSCLWPWFTLQFERLSGFWIEHFQSSFSRWNARVVNGNLSYATLTCAFLSVRLRHWVYSWDLNIEYIVDAMSLDIVFLCTRDEKFRGWSNRFFCRVYNLVLVQPRALKIN